MNLREGTRRLALLLGVAGAILGGFASYLELQTVLDQRARHNKFEQLAASEVVQQERKNLQLWKPVIDPKTGERIQAPPGFIPDDPYAAIALHNQVEYDAQGKPLPPTPQGVEYDRYGKPLSARGGATPPPITKPNGETDPFDVNKGGIKTINWTHDYGVESIVTEDGQTLYPTSAPSAWLYLLIALFPVFGFFIPWGAIRAIGWVGAGFFQPSK
jgi:hypothetical protein